MFCQRWCLQTLYMRLEVIARCDKCGGRRDLRVHLLPGSSRVDVNRFITCRSFTETPIVSNSTPESSPSASQMSPFTVCSYCWLGAVCMLLVLCDTVASQAPSEENCAGSGATVRQLVSWPHEQSCCSSRTDCCSDSRIQPGLKFSRSFYSPIQKLCWSVSGVEQLLVPFAVQILYDLRTADAQEIAAVDKLFMQRMQECESVLYPGSSFGGAAITTTPTVYGCVLTNSPADWGALLQGPTVQLSWVVYHKRIG